jgi:hypothetical protein
MLQIFALLKTKLLTLGLITLNSKFVSLFTSFYLSHTFPEWCKWWDIVMRGRKLTLGLSLGPLNIIVKG